MASLFDEAAQRPEPTLNLHARFERYSGTLLTLILRHMIGPLTNDRASGELNLQGIASIDAMEKQRPFLLRMAAQSYAEATEKQSLRQWRELAGFAASFSPENARFWLLPFAQLLLDSGVLSAADLSPVGMVPMLLACAAASGVHSSAPLIMLLLENGSDLHETDGKDRTLLYFASAATLADLAHAGYLTVAAHWQRDSKDRSAAEYTTYRRRSCSGMLQGQATLWQDRTRPLLLRMLSQPSVLIPDLASIVLDYIDGGGKSSASDADINDEEAGPKRDDEENDAEHTAGGEEELADHSESDASEEDDSSEEEEGQEEETAEDELAASMSRRRMS
jgi:hypothetical protein